MKPTSGNLARGRFGGRAIALVVAIAIAVAIAIDVAVM
jgi:hypothetical protein